jgi:hypothetical protein
MAPSKQYMLNRAELTQIIEDLNLHDHLRVELGEI